MRWSSPADGERAHLASIARDLAQLPRLARTPTALTLQRPYDCRRRRAFADRVAAKLPQFVHDAHHDYWRAPLTRENYEAARRLWTRLKISGGLQLWLRGLPGRPQYIPDDEWRFRWTDDRPVLSPAPSDAGTIAITRLRNGITAYHRTYHRTRAYALRIWSIYQTARAAGTIRGQTASHRIRNGPDLDRYHDWSIYRYRPHAPIFGDIVVSGT